MTNPDTDFRRYDEEVLAFVNRGVADADEQLFNELALGAFELQFHTDKAYRQFCTEIKATPGVLNCWQDIPAVASFSLTKTTDATFPAKKAEEICLASGVAMLQRKRGPFFPDNEIRTLEAAVNNLLEKAYVFPEVDRMKMLFLAPTPVMAPGMVMASGLERIRQRFGTKDSRFLISFTGLDLKAFITALRKSEKTGEPIALLGATWGFDYFFNSCRQEGIRFRLPEGSRIVDSGGYVGRYAKCSKDEFFGKCGEVLGIPTEFCINALWLCENTTVYFDNVTADFLVGMKRDRYKVSPPWTRTIAVDPRDFRPVAKGSIGLLRHYDLTNRAMAIAVQTGNVGYETGDGFEVLGKWNRNMNSPDIERSPAHPGGRTISAVMDAFLAWKFSKIGKIDSAIK